LARSSATTRSASWTLRYRPSRSEEAGDKRRRCVIVTNPITATRWGRCNRRLQACRPIADDATPPMASLPALSGSRRLCEATIFMNGLYQRL
jgi:hypothetical protein